MHSSLTLTFWEYTEVYVQAVHKTCTGIESEGRWTMSFEIKNRKAATYSGGKSWINGHKATHPTELINNGSPVKKWPACSAKMLENCNDSVTRF